MIMQKTSITNQEFELFKSDTCQKVKKDAKQWILDTLRDDRIRRYSDQGNYLFALYTLAMLDRILKQKNIDPPREYNDLRIMRFTEPVMPMSAEYINIDLDTADPEFMKYNIVEGDVDNVV